MTVVSSGPSQQTLGETPPLEPANYGPELLTTASKLVAIMEDPHGEFLPRTHREKNAALTIIDYIDNPEYPGGLHDHLAEIYQKQISNAIEGRSASGRRSRAAGAVAGGIAVQSVLFEYADYYTSAVLAHEHSTRFKAVVDDCLNPRVKLAQLVEAQGDDSGATNLIQRTDLSELAKGRIITPFDPLLTVENRWAKPKDGKNKTIYDVYAVPRSSRDVQDYIQRNLEEITVGDVRAQLATVIGEQRNRAVFWSKVLRARYFEYQPKADKALAVTNIPDAHAS